MFVLSIAIVCLFVHVIELPNDGTSQTNITNAVLRHARKQLWRENIHSTLAPKEAT